MDTATTTSRRTAGTPCAECAIPFRLRRLQYVSFVDGYEVVIGRLIDELRSGVPAETASTLAPPPPPPVKPASLPAVTPRRGAGRLAITLRWALLGGVFTGLAAYLFLVEDRRFQGLQVPNHLRDTVVPYIVIGTVLWAVVGAIAAGVPGAARRTLAAAIAVMVLWRLLFGGYADVVLTGIAMGGPIVGLLVAAVLRPRARKTRSIH